MVFIRILKTKVQYSVFKEGTSTNVGLLLLLLKQNIAFVLNQRYKKLDRGRSSLAPLGSANELLFFFVIYLRLVFQKKVNNLKEQTMNYS